MRILELEIWSIRGIRHLLLKPEGNNFLIYGPNGSGKSAIVDALDFLFTGRISRLSGKGTGGLKMDKLGPHLDCTPSEAAVRAVIKLPDTEKPLEFKRCMSSPSSIEYEWILTSHIEKMLSMARQGRHVLTRKDILNYITAEPGTRARQLQELLDITEVENIRKVYVRARSDIQNNLKAAQSEISAARAALSETIGSSSPDNDEIIKAVNRCRLILGGRPVSGINWRELKTGLNPPSAYESGGTADLGHLQKNIDYLCAVVNDQNRNTTEQLDRRIRNLIDKIDSNSGLVHSLSRVRLTELGLTMIGEEGNCPLCGTVWPAGKLHNYLQGQLSRVRDLMEYEKAVKTAASEMIDSASAVVAVLEKILPLTEKLDIDSETRSALGLWESKLKAFLDALAQPLDNYPLYKPERVHRLLAPDNIDAVLQKMLRVMQNNKTAAPDTQGAWDTLTRLEENLKALGAAGKNLRYWESCYDKANILLENYIKARDTVLEKLYLDVEDRFVNLYRQLHDDEDENFTAKIGPSGAGVTMGVNFYGRGIYPPNALHSEGHQDSMGICLYFALAERLTGNLLELVVLDDVVLSIDADHRAKLCRLLAGSFSNRQLCITTHNKSWAQQLLSAKVVAPRDTIQLSNWSIDTGPLVRQDIL